MFDKHKANRRFQALHVEPNPGVTLVVGSKIYEGQNDRRALFEKAVGVDMLPGDGVDHIIDMEEPLDPKDIGLFDHIDCHSVLEHSKRPWLLAANLERLMVDGGSIFVSVPFVWKPHGYPNDYWRFTPEAVKLLFHAIEWKIIRFVTDEIEDRFRIKGRDVDGWTHFPKTEVLAFGHKKKSEEGGGFEPPSPAKVAS